MIAIATSNSTNVKPRLGVGQIMMVRPGGEAFDRFQRLEIIGKTASQRGSRVLHDYEMAQLVAKLQRLISSEFHRSITNASHKPALK